MKTSFQEIDLFWFFFSFSIISSRIVLPFWIVFKNVLISSMITRMISLSLNSRNHLKVANNSVQIFWYQFKSVSLSSIMLYVILLIIILSTYHAAIFDGINQSLISINAVLAWSAIILNLLVCWEYEIPVNSSNFLREAENTSVS